MIFSGFRQNLIGKGLNEGYTELLTSRMYKMNYKITHYKNEVKIARLFELFFDDYKTMENYYFRHNLFGFISYMEKFIPHDEIIKIICDIDKINLLDSDINLVKFYYSTKVQITLYNWFIINCKDQDKIRLFRDLICENSIISAMINNQEYKLCRESSCIPFNHLENEDECKFK